VPDGWLNRLSPLEPASLLFCQRPVLAAMNDLHRRIVLIHAAIPQVDNHLFRGFAGVFEQDGGLLQLLIENVPVIRVSRKPPASE
jgi:hypothetical protein